MSQRFFPFCSLLVLLQLLAACTDTVSQSGGFSIGRVATWHLAIDGDGAVVAYTSDEGQLYIRDYAVSGDVNTVCRSYTGVAPNGSCARPQLSADGNLVVFESDADNLVEDDDNGEWDIFLLNRATGVTERITELADGTGFDGGSGDPSIDSSGRYIAFWTSAKNLPGPLPFEFGIRSVAVYDRESGEFTVASTTLDRLERLKGYAPHLSADGSKLVYSSNDIGIVDGVEDGAIWHVYQFDLASRINTLVSISYDGEPLQASDSYAPRTNGDGSKVVFYSEAGTLSEEFLVDDTGMICPPLQLYVRDMVAGKNERVTVEPSGVCMFFGGPGVVPFPVPEWQAFFPAADIDDTGDIVVFGGIDLEVLEDPDISLQPKQAYLRNLATGTTELVSYGTQSRNGELVKLIADDISHYPRISGDGNRIVYHSVASNLTENDFQITPLWDAFRLTRNVLGP